MAASAFVPKLEALRQRIFSLARMAPSAAEPPLLFEILEELRGICAGLTVAEEELHQQSDSATRAEREVYDERARYRELFELAPEAYLETNSTGVIRRANGAASELFCVRTDFLVGKPLVAFIATEERSGFRSWLNEIRPLGISEREVRLSLRHRPEIDVSLRVTSSLTPSGEPGQLRWLVRDVTERKRNEAEAWELNAILEARVRERTAELEAANWAKNDILVREREARALAEALLEDAREADRRKDDFLAMLAHELRNPLAPIVNALKIIETTGEETETIHRARQIAERQVRHLVRMVDDLLDVSRVQRGLVSLRKQPLDLAEALVRSSEAERELIRERSHEYTAEISDEPLWIEGDATRIEQVFVNLLNNAIKYTPQGGKIWLTAARDGDEAVVRVRDTGVGIPPDVLPHVFEPFTQARQSLARSSGGLGLGLALVKRLVEMHSGSVRIKAGGPAGGTEVTVRLPLRTPPARAVQRATVEATNGGDGSLRVLIVDDNVDAAESLAEILRIWGYEPIVAYDGPSAIDHARRLEPEAILLDIGLPGMDGFEVAHQLRAIEGLKRSLLVAVTGYGRDGDREAATKAGFDRHLTKPVDPRALHELLAERTERASEEPRRPALRS